MTLVLVAVWRELSLPPQVQQLRVGLRRAVKRDCDYVGTSDSRLLCLLALALPILHDIALLGVEVFHHCGGLRYGLGCCLELSGRFEVVLHESAGCLFRILQSHCLKPLISQFKLHRFAEY